MCSKKKNIALLWSFDNSSDAGSINIWSLRDSQTLHRQHTITPPAPDLYPKLLTGERLSPGTQVNKSRHQRTFTVARASCP